MRTAHAAPVGPCTVERICKPFIAIAARAAVFLAACGGGYAQVPVVQVDVSAQPFAPSAGACTGAFVAHPLPHVTRSDQEELVFFVANGAGVALADLDGDNRIDIVLAGMHAPPSVLWNRGGLEFRKETLDIDGSRAVNAVDVEGDGRLDLVFTHAGNRPSLWRLDTGLTPPAFRQVPPRHFIGRYNPYSIAWADLDDDTDLDMVGASYNAELMARGFGTPSGGGVFLFTNEGGALKPDLLVSHAQALAVLLTDLDNDGALDLYVVNGMINEGLFGDFPGDELVEENQALRNDGTGHFAPAPEWGLGATEGGRGMSFADLDNDGDLDIVVNNFAEPSMLFENRLCGGAALQVELYWEGSLNSRAIGAQLRLHASDGRYVREMRAGSGYLSSLPARVHFGLGDTAGSDVQRLEVIWPDGSTSHIDDPPVGALLEVRRPAAAAQPARRPLSRSGR